MAFLVPPPSVPAQSRTAEQWAVLAVEAARQGRHRRAVSLYSKAIKLKPDYLAAIYNRGLSHLALGKHRAAAKDFRQCLKLRPNWSDAKHNLYVALKRLGRAPPGLIASDPALIQARQRRIVERATQELRDDPGNVQALIRRGRALTRLGRHKWARRDFDRALSLRPKSAVALLARGEFFLRLR
ncbi:MAG: tetratricopeptide repeat protein, partial [Proteobacteria bacterium]|nr:tetratricopeptide repeat protein [Pseudomonadota bacterium]